MRGKQSKPLKSSQPTASTGMWSDHVAVRGNRAECDRCGAGENLKDGYDPCPIDPVARPDDHARQAEKRTAYTSQVWDFINKHRACPAQPIEPAPKRGRKKQGGLF